MSDVEREPAVMVIGYWPQIGDELEFPPTLTRPRLFVRITESDRDGGTFTGHVYSPGIEALRKVVTTSFALWGKL